MLNRTEGKIHSFSEKLRGAHYQPERKRTFVLEKSRIAVLCEVKSVSREGTLFYLLCSFLPIPGTKE